MNRVFRNYLHAFVNVFIDDILVYEGEREDDWMVVLQVLKEHKKISMNSKCEFLLKSVAFLCYSISSEGIEVNSKKTKAVENRPRPLTPTNIRSSLGFAAYYRRFVDGFASIYYPLNTLTQKCVMFEWWEACQSIFPSVKI